MLDYKLPVPDYAICDVGITIYEIHDNVWRPWEAWVNAIAADWADKSYDELAQLFVDLDTLTLQEIEKQNTFKLSYYAPSDIDDASLLKKMQRRLVAHSALLLII
ncbi:MAG: HAD family hydrolase [Gammaproteobacteria bacterium]